MTSLIKVAFASSGDKSAVPETDAGGGVNMTQGYGQAYSLDPATDPSAKRIERDKMNWLFNLITKAINEIQVSGVAPFITSVDNGGSAFSYGKGALVSLGGIVYQSLVATNVTTPPGANWAALPEKIQPLDATLTAIAGLVGEANKLPYFNGADTAALTDLTQVGRDLIGKTDIAAVLTYLGLDIALNGKQPKDSTLTNLSGKDVAALRTYLALGSAALATLGYDSGNAMKVVGPGGFASSANMPQKVSAFMYERAAPLTLYSESVCIIQCPGPSNEEWMQVAASFLEGSNKCWITKAVHTAGGTAPGKITAMELWHDKNTTVDTNGFIKRASPVVKLFADGKFEVNEESEGCQVIRSGVGEYLITGCLGLNADTAWSGNDGGFEIPTDRNKQPRVWLDYEVNTDGSVSVKTYHRTHPEAPLFAQNLIGKKNDDGSFTETIQNGEPIDIPSDSFVSVRVEMPIDSINNQKIAAARQAEQKAIEEEDRRAREQALADQEGKAE